MADFKPNLEDVRTAIEKYVHPGQILGDITEHEGAIYRAAVSDPPGGPLLLMEFRVKLTVDMHSMTEMKEVSRPGDVK